MPEPRLISGCLAELSAQLPAPIVVELADGLEQTHQHYLAQGLAPDAAERAALAEFGEPQVVVAAFTAALPARRAARRLLATGPAVGACWGAALVTSRAWAWPVPPAVRIMFGLCLLTMVGLLAAASFARRYRLVGRTGVAGCAGIATLDATMLTAVALAIPGLAWPAVLAIVASTVRLALTARALRCAVVTTRAQ